MKIIGRVLLLAAVGVLGAGAAIASGGPSVSLPTLPAPTISTPITTATVPKVTTPTVTVPTVTTPTPTVTAPKVTTPTPTVTAPKVTTTSTAPAPTVPKITTSAPSGPKVTATAPATPALHAAVQPSAPAAVSSTYATGSPVRRSSSAPASASRAARAHKSPARIGFRTAVAHFRLRRPARIRVVVRELAPICRRVGSYSFAAERGRHTVRVPMRIGRRRLGVGTYVLVGRTHMGRKVFEAKARIVRGKLKGETRRTLLVRRGAVVNRCAAPTLAVAPLIADSPTVRIATASHGVRGAAVPPLHGSAPPASRVIRAISLSGAPTPLRSLLLVLLTISISLLSLAAIPQRALPTGPVAALFARRRTHLALAGIWLLAIVVIVIASE